MGKISARVREQTISTMQTTQVKLSSTAFRNSARPFTTVSKHVCQRFSLFLSALRASTTTFGSSHAVSFTRWTNRLLFHSKKCWLFTLTMGFLLLNSSFASISCFFLRPRLRPPDFVPDVDGASRSSCSFPFFSSEHPSCCGPMIIWGKKVLVLKRHTFPIMFIMYL